MIEELRQDRDRFVGFAFAAADLLLELDGAGTVRSVSGAAHTVCGRDRDELTGRSILELFAMPQRRVVRRLLERATTIGRIEVAVLCVEHPLRRPVPVTLGGCQLPHLPERLFVTLTLLPTSLLPDKPVARDAETGLVEPEAFVALAAQAARNASAEQRLALLRVDGLSDAARELPPECADELMAEIGAALRAASAGGDSAARLGNDAFGLVLGASGPGAPGGSSEQRLQHQIGDAARAAGLAEGSLTTRVASLDLAMGELDDREAARALAYAIKSFSETKGTGFTLTSLREGLTAAVASTAARFGDLRRSIVEDDFTMAFQPIVMLPGRRVHHYEALARFADGRNPYEVITFGEEVGLIEEFDLVVCRKVVAALDAHPDLMVAVNISGRSVQSTVFRAGLQELLEPRDDLRGRLMLELTESAVVERIDEATKLLRWVKGRGFPVCLDDFGAGAAAYSYLRHFEVDYVKIDGPFLRAAMTSDRERSLIRSICRVCRELQCGVIGEMIEDEPMMSRALELGIGFGQGWLFGKPLPQLPMMARSCG